MGGTSVTLRHQLELYREIARQQAQDIDIRAAEHKWLEDSLRQRYADSSTLKISPGKAEIDALIGKVKTEVERLQSEVGVWRGAPWDSDMFSHNRGHNIERQEDTNHELERQRWQAEKSRLERQVREVQERARHFEAATASGCKATHGMGLSAEFADLASVQAEADYLQDELAAERSAVARARERLAAAREEADEERRSHVRLTTQGEQALAATLQDIQLTERRIEVEIELQRAQQAQLQSVQTTSLTLKAQVQRAQQETQELRASLEQNQDTLRRLRR